MKQLPAYLHPCAAKCLRGVPLPGTLKHQTSKATTAIGDFALRLLHAMPVLIHLQATGNHRSLSVSWLTGPGIVSRPPPQFFQILQLRCHEDWCSPAVLEMARRTGHILRSSYRHNTPVIPQALRCLRENVFGEAPLIQEHNLPPWEL